MSAQSPSEVPIPADPPVPDEPILLDRDNTITPTKRARPVVSKFILFLFVIGGLPSVSAVFGALWLATDYATQSARVSRVTDAVVQAMLP